MRRIWYSLSIVLIFRAKAWIILVFLCATVCHHLLLLRLMSYDKLTVDCGVSSWDLLVKWMGESEKLVENGSWKCSLHHLHEIGSLCRQRAEGNGSKSSRKVKMELLVQTQVTYLDISTSPASFVFFVGNCHEHCTLTNYIAVTQIIKTKPIHMHIFIFHILTFAKQLPSITIFFNSNQTIFAVLVLAIMMTRSSFLLLLTLHML